MRQIGPSLWSNRKSHTRFRLVQKLTTLDDLEGSLCTLFAPFQNMHHYSLLIYCIYRSPKNTHTHLAHMVNSVLRTIPKNVNPRIPCASGSVSLVRAARHSRQIVVANRWTPLPVLRMFNSGLNWTGPPAHRKSGASAAYIGRIAGLTCSGTGLPGGVGRYVGFTPYSLIISAGITESLVPWWSSLLRANNHEINSEQQYRSLGRDRAS